MQLKFSGKQVIKAGELLISEDIFRDDILFNSAFDVLSYWRFSHESSLENAINLLQYISLRNDKSAYFAKRLKRYISIVNKLRRFPDMKLKNMQDIGGCRAVVSNTKKVTKIVRDLKKIPEFKNGNGKIRYKDYINNPKEDGYRGYHLIGKFLNSDGEKRNIEIQLRTRLQHDWATTLEIVDLFTGQALKSNQGKKDWKIFFKSVSEQFSIMESIHMFDALNDIDKKKKYYGELSKNFYNNDKAIIACLLAQDQAKKLDVVTILEAYANSLKIIDSRLEEKFVDGYALLEVDTLNTTVYSTLFDANKSSEAEKSYGEAEKKAAEQDGLVVALVSTTAVGGIKEAYPNYFADSTDFLRHLLLIIGAPIPRPKRNFLSALFGSR